MKYLIMMSLVINLAFASGTAKLADYMIQGSGVIELLGKYGIQGNDADAVKSYVGSAMMALSKDGSSLTKSELSEAISKLPVTGADANIRKELQILLDKPEGQVKKEDVVKAVNHIIYLANRHGKSVVVTCADCVNTNLASHGFKFTVNNLKNTQISDLLAKIIPSNPAELNSFISARMRKLGMGDYSKVTPELVAPEEEKSLALFLALAESGDAKQKAFVNAVKALSSKNGKTNIIDSKNPHKFWREIASDMDSKSMTEFTNLLNQSAERRIRENTTAEIAFLRNLEERAKGNPELMEKLELMKVKRCFFK